MISIILKSYDVEALDRAAQKLTKVLTNSGVKVIGPHPLPTKIKRHTILSGPHIDKHARHQLEQRTMTRIIRAPVSTVNVLDNFEYVIPSTVHVEIKTGGKS